MDPNQYRCFRIQDIKADPEQLKGRVEDLRQVIFNLIHEVAVLRKVLEDQGLLTPEKFRELRAKSMVQDHNGAGASPWRHHSYYPHTLDEEAYLRQILGYDDAQIKKYNDEADFLSQLT